MDADRVYRSSYGQPGPSESIAKTATRGEAAVTLASNQKNAWRLVDSRNALRLLETSHPPTYYVPPIDVSQTRLVPAAGGSFCEWKGQARYWSVQLQDTLIERCAWSYPDPAPGLRRPPRSPRVLRSAVRRVPG